MKGVQCYELFRGIALKNDTFLTSATIFKKCCVEINLGGDAKYNVKGVWGFSYPIKLH